jgi:small nuclear ribonucleoprotein (snRNP)-like protein
MSKTLEKTVGQEVIVWMANDSEVHGTLTHVDDRYITVKTGNEMRFLSWAAIVVIRLA